MVASYPSPTNVTELRAFLGLASYYRRFIKDFSKVANPMFELLKKDIKFKWTQEHQEAMNHIKRKLTQAPLLQAPDWNKPFILQTDGSKDGLGAVLC